MSSIVVAESYFISDQAIDSTVRHILIKFIYLTPIIYAECGTSYQNDTDLNIPGR